MSTAITGAARTIAGTGHCVWAADALGSLFLFFADIHKGRGEDRHNDYD